MFVFKAFTRTDSGDEFVEVFGGRRGKQKMRYVKSDRVLAIKTPKRRVRRTAVD